VKVRTVWIGRRGATAYHEQVETYRRRVGQRWPAEERVVRPVSGGRGNDPRRALREEARVLSGVLEPGWTTVALDEGGRPCTSTEFARRLAELEDRSTPGLDFVIGSDLGLDRRFVADADWILSLSSMTLPHPLARLFLWEQLFRATHILGGGGYHRGNLQ
jgi:23S rRNA (pseudouridine1915-N3)-methyltransferase